MTKQKELTGFWKAVALREEPPELAIFRGTMELPGIPVAVWGTYSGSTQPV
jgi:hypothetical protein